MTGYWNTPVTQPGSLLRLHNKYRGERIFIFGSGPSLQALESGVLRNMAREFTFVSNKLVWWRGLAFEPWAHGLSEHEDLPYLLSYQNAQWRTRHFVCSWQPVEASRWQWVAKAPDGIIISDVGMVGLGDDLPPLPSAASTPITLGVQLAAWLGFTKMYLLGCDNTAVGQVFNTAFIRAPHLARTEASVARCVQDLKAAGRTLKDCTAGGTLHLNGAIEYTPLEDVL